MWKLVVVYILIMNKIIANVYPRANGSISVEIRGTTTFHKSERMSLQNFFEKNHVTHVSDPEYLGSFDLVDVNEYFEESEAYENI